MRKTVFTLFILVGMCFVTNAQVTSVKYLIDYNDLNANYDVKLFIEEGSATTVVQRIQFNAQITVVVPTGSTLSIGEFFNPIENNQNYNGTDPAEWGMGVPSIAPPTQPEEDFYNFFPILDPVSSYNNLFAGDTVTLFSLNIDVEPCENSVRLFENGVDPSSADMPNGGDYSNAFSLGSVEPLYNGNIDIWYSNGWEITLDDYEVCPGECVELIPNIICSGDDLTYLWSTGENTPTIIVCPEEDSTITLVITDPNMQTLNLESTITVGEAPAAPIVGANSPICEGEAIMLTAENIAGATYSWMGPNGFTSTDQNPVISNVPAEASGFYACIVEINGCESQVGLVEAVVNALPIATFNGEDTLCTSGFTSMAPAIGGSWESSDTSVAIIGNSGFVTAVSEGTAVFTYTSNETGCVSLPSDTLWVFDSPNATVEDLRICIGDITFASPVGNGTWTSSNTSVAIINNETGVITGIAQGTTLITYEDDNSGCESLDFPIIVDPNPAVSISDSSICVASETLLSPSNGGTWEALDPSIASLMDNTVTGESGGTAGFIFTSSATGCISDTAFVNVDTLPITNVTGPDTICLGSTTTIEPSSGGTWASSDASIATVDNFGNITGVGVGKASFIFTSGNTLCASLPSDSVMVIELPDVDALVDSVCLDVDFQLTPASGGFWISSDTLIATVDSLNGMVTSIAPGEVAFTFTAFDTGCSKETETITVLPTPFDDIMTVSSCVGETAMIFPGLVGTWISSDTSVVVVDIITGQITAVGPGTAAILFLDGETGCSADFDVEVFITPEITFNGSSGICLSDTIFFSGNIDGVWSTEDSTIASVNQEGVLIGVSEGTTNLFFTDAITGCTSNPVEITVYPPPFDSIVTISICVGTTAIIFPGMEGIWSSSDSEIIEVNELNGELTAVGPGIATIFFIDGQTGCPADFDIEVFPIPQITLDGSNEICLASTTTISSDIDGVWISDDSNIALVNTLGEVLGVGEGTTDIFFTASNSGCVSDPVTVTIVPLPELFLNGPDEICIGATTSLLSNENGSWMSNDTAVAVIDSNGMVTGVGTGVVNFVFTGETCSAETDDVEVVGEELMVSIDTTICEGMEFMGFTESGTYTSEAVDSITGCPLIITIDLEVLPSDDPLCAVNTQEIVKNNVKLYPNPANEIVFIKSNSDIEEVSIYNANYQLMHQIFYHDNGYERQINIGEFNTGLYILCIKSGENRVYKKIVKK